MASKQNEHIRVIHDDDYERRERIVEHKPSTQSVLVSRISKLIWLFGALLIALIAFRFVLLLIGANPNNGFVDVVYDLSDVFVQPFVGIVEAPTVGENGLIDVASLFAMGVYLLVIAAADALFRTIFSDTSGHRKVKTIERGRS